MSQMVQSAHARFENLRKRPLFTSLTEAQWEKLKPVMHYEAFEPSNQILAASDTSQDLFWIDSGKVSVQRETPFGKQTLAELKEDDAFGEIALIDGQGHTADVFALSSTQAWRLDGQALQHLFRDDHPLACHFYRYFWRTLAEKIYLANDYLKGFFAGEPEPPPSESPSRPAWFAPPAGADSSLSNELSALPSFQVPDEEKRHALAQRGLSSSEVELLLERGEELSIPAEDAVFHEGDFGDTLYFILHGQVRISKELPGVGAEALAILEAGEIFGEMAIVSENAKRSADCLAHEQPVLLLAFRLHILNAMQGQSKTDYSFLQAVCKMMSHRLREINEKLVSWKMMRGGW